MTVRTGKRGKNRMALGIAFWLACAGTIPVYGGQWVQPLEGQWAYEEDGTFLAGWREIDGAWYCFGADGLMQTGWVRAGEKQLWHYLDQETGAWQPRPVLNEEAAQKLLENAVRKTGYYDNEKYEWEVRIDYMEEDMIYGSIRIITGPSSWITLNTYRIKKKDGTVSADAGGKLNLYEY